MGKNTLNILKENDVGSIGIGAMIVFIAMVLVAGIAASVLIQTSTTLESKAMLTGEATTKEVSTGVAVVNIEGHNTSGIVDLLAIMVRPRAGSSDVDLGHTIIEISNSQTKSIIVYDGSTCVQPNETGGDLLNAAHYPAAPFFGVIVLEDADNSCSDANPVINSGDLVIITIDVDDVFGGFNVRENIKGLVIPEEGSPGVISFRVPASLTRDVVELQ